MRIATTRPLDATSGALAPGELIGRLAVRALLRELDLTPKPGLVDRANSGAHRDMDYGTFRVSVAAIAPWFPVFFERGMEGRAVAAAAFLPRIRGDGLACERAMFAATDGVNTHKGSVFSLGLLCAAAGRLHGRGAVIERGAVCAEVARICAGLVERELAAPGVARTAGELLYRQHGLTGARGEAQSGFATARRHGVAPYLRARAQRMSATGRPEREYRSAPHEGGPVSATGRPEREYRSAPHEGGPVSATGRPEREYRSAPHEGGPVSDECALHEALLHLMAHNRDTNLVARGGMAGLSFVQDEARRLLEGLLPPPGVRVAQLVAFDRALIGRNLSPGGSADLLAVSGFLAHLDDLWIPPFCGCD